MRRAFAAWLSSAVLAALPLRGQAPASLRLSSPFGDSMVLPQHESVPIRGTGAPGREVVVRVPWQDASIRGKVGADGRFAVHVATPAAGGPFTVSVQSGDERIELGDVLVGEVWLGCGQSNMEMTVGNQGGWQKGVRNWEQEVAAADLPRLRLFTVGKRTAASPQAEVDGQWQVCTPATASAFSATAFFFGRELLHARGEPVGLVVSSWGGSVCEAWTSAAGLADFPEFHDAVARAQASGDAAARSAQREQFWRGVDASGPGAGAGAAAAPGFDDAAWQSVSLPHVWSRSGLAEFDGVGFYRLHLTVPAAWAGHELVLMLGPIDDMDSVWFGGHRIGGTEEPGHWAERREYRVPGALVAAGPTVLAVRVVDTGGEGGIAGDAEGMRLAPAGGELGALGLAGPWRFLRAAALDTLPPKPPAPDGDPDQPAVLWNGMVAPLAGFPFRGVLWYQGESNREHAAQYERLFPALIRDWRRAFGRELPFYFVQIAPYGYRDDAGETFDLRLAQAAALALPATGMATTTDIGDPGDIHPRDKQTVGRRLLLLALRKTYGRADVVCDAPRVRRVTAADGALRLEFDGADGGLRLQPTATGTFEVAGADGVFAPATARLDGAVLVLRSDAVPAPARARYCHAADALGGLGNGSGLPAGPFLAALPD